MKRPFSVFTLGCAILCLNTAVKADTSHNVADNAGTDLEQKAADAARRGDSSDEVAAYEQLVDKNPDSVPLLLKYADALKKDRQWDSAVSEYEKVLRLQPNNTEAILGIGTVRRWQGNIDGATSAYERARTQDPKNPEAMLGLASTFAIDHNLDSADAYYEQAVQKWPENSEVQQAAYDFRRQRNPKLYGYWESGLSSETRQGGAIIPFAGQEEVGVEYQKIINFAPQLGHTEIYSRDDKTLLYTHYFGLNHMLDFAARASEYKYNVPDSALGYSSIDTYHEYRIRYTVPITQQQVFAVRYTARPTILKLSQDKFTAHKVEAELNSHWTPRFSTLLGGGWLRDLDSNSTSISNLTNRSLVKVGVQLDMTNRFSLAAKYITNPDLDNTMRATSILEGNYSITDTWSGIARARLDDYKTGANQTGTYLGLRFVPNSHWWSEFGLKYEQRGSESGNYGLVSINYRF